MESHRCFECEHECKINVGSMFKDPTPCPADGHLAEWAKVTDMAQRPTKANLEKENTILKTKLKERPVPHKCKQLGCDDRGDWFCDPSCGRFIKYN